MAVSLAITIQTIRHDKHRYPTVGDYWKEGSCDFVQISSMGDRRHEFLVAIHELIEMFLTEQRGISEPNQIKPFDEWFEENDLPGEPGDHPDAPYRREHRFAENIERQIAHELGVDWNEYEKIVDALWHPVGKSNSESADNGS